MPGYVKRALAAEIISGWILAWEYVLWIKVLFGLGMTMVGMN